MRLLPTRSATLLTALLAGVAIAPPAGAQTPPPPSHSISAAPTEVRPTESTTVTGTTNCPSAPVTVTLTYTDPDDQDATATATTTTDGAGEYTVELAVPEDAVAGEPASVQAVVTCAGDTPVESNTVELEIVAWVGTLAVEPDEGEPGDEVTVTGDRCYGDDVLVVLLADGEPIDEIEVTLAEDRTFQGVYELPAGLEPGDYEVGAVCPGTDYEPVPLRVTGQAQPSPSPTSSPAPTPTAPPAPVVDGRVDYTG